MNEGAVADTVSQSSVAELDSSFMSKEIVWVDDPDDEEEYNARYDAFLRSQKASAKEAAATAIELEDDEGAVNAIRTDRLFAEDKAIDKGLAAPGRLPDHNRTGFNISAHVLDQYTSKAASLSKARRFHSGITNGLRLLGDLDEYSEDQDECDENTNVSPRYDTPHFRTLGGTNALADTLTVGRKDDRFIGTMNNTSDSFQNGQLVSFASDVTNKLQTMVDVTTGAWTEQWSSSDEEEIVFRSIPPHIASILGSNRCRVWWRECLLLGAHPDGLVLGSSFGDALNWLREPLRQHSSPTLLANTLTSILVESYSTKIAVDAVRAVQKNLAAFLKADADLAKLSEHLISTYEPDDYLRWDEFVSAAAKIWKSAGLPSESVGSNILNDYHRSTLGGAVNGGALSATFELTEANTLAKNNITAADHLARRIPLMFCCSSSACQRHIRPVLGMDGAFAVRKNVNKDSTNAITTTGLSEDPKAAMIRQIAEQQFGNMLADNPDSNSQQFASFNTSNDTDVIILPPLMGSETQKQILTVFQISLQIANFIDSYLNGSLTTVNETSLTEYQDTSMNAEQYTDGADSTRYLFGELYQPRQIREIFSSADRFRLEMVYNRHVLELRGYFRIKNVLKVIRESQIEIDKTRIPTSFVTHSDFVIENFMGFLRIAAQLRLVFPPKEDPSDKLLRYKLPDWIRQEFKSSEILLYQHLFTIIDRNGDDSIDAQELCDLLNSFGAPITEKEACSMLPMYDLENNGTISFVDFLILIYKIQHGAVGIETNQLTETLKEMKTQLRVFEELDDVQRNPPEYCDVIHYGGRTVTCEFNITAPNDSPFVGQIFALEVVFHDDYPYRPPNVRIKSRLCTLNWMVHLDGSSRMLHLAQVWDPSWNIAKLLRHVVQTLRKGEPQLLPSKLKQIFYSWKDHLQHNNHEQDVTQLTISDSKTLHLMKSLPRVEQMHLNVLFLYLTSSESYLQFVKSNFS